MKKASADESGQFLKLPPTSNPCISVNVLKTYHSALFLGPEISPRTKQTVVVRFWGNWNNRLVPFH